MEWDKPKKPWQWLMLLSPAGINVVFDLIGFLISTNGYDPFAWSIFGLLASTLAALGLSIALARVNPKLSDKLSAALFLFLMLTFGNLAVGFAGCTALLIVHH